MKNTGQHQEGARNRQKILDYLHEHPGTLAPLIYANLDFTRSTGSTLLSGMLKANEVSREPAVYEYIDPTGRKSSVQSFAYTALVKQTRDYEGEYKPGQKHGDAPQWVTRSCDVRDPYTSRPYKNQGGQGAYAPRSICSLEYV